MIRTDDPGLADLEREVDALLGRLTALRAEIGKLVVGQDDAVQGLLIGLLAGGHCLLEGVPGLGKTLMVRALSRALDLEFKRIQFTPDLMPSDIVGTEVLEEDVGTGRRVFRFNRGPVFANLVLADEINRSPAKTQAALLEAMQESAVTYGGTTHVLPRPFFVLATQNPIEQAGTYPLPEAQLDRFLLYLRVSYPSPEEERRVVAETTSGAQPELHAVLGAADVVRAQGLVRDVHISSALLDYAVRLVRATRPAESEIGAVREAIEWGAGPRGGQAMVVAAKARALLAGRFAVLLDDLTAVAPAVLRHRLVLSFRGQAERITPDSIVAAVLAAVPPPQSPLGR